MLNRLIRFSLVSVFALAIVGHGVAFAQDEGGDDTEKKDDSGDKAGGDMGGDTGGDTMGDGGEKKDDTAKKDDAAAGGDTGAAAGGGKRQGVWDARLNERARTLPKGVIGIDVNLPTLASFDIIGLGFGVGYGVSDQLEVGVSYDVLLDPSSDFKGPFLLHANYNAMSGADMDLTVGASGGYNLSSEGLADLTLGAVFDKLLMDRKLNAYGSLSIPIGLEDPQAISAALAVGAWYQASGTAKSGLAVGVNLPLVNIALKDAGDTTLIGGDFFSINVGALWSNRMLDVGVMVGTDLKNSPGDNIALTLAVGYNMGGTGMGAVSMK